MYCSSCGVQVADQASFCSSCGKPTAISSAPAPTYAPPYASTQPPMLPPYQKKPATNAGLGFGITSLIVGILTLSYAFIDYQGISSGSYGYIYFSEIGLLFILSAVGIVFGSISTRAENAIGKGGLGVSIAAMLFTFYLAQFGG